MSPKSIVDVDSATAEGLAREERAIGAAAGQQQEERERLIAQTHQMIGKIKAADMFGKFANVSNLVWLQEVKESKIYKDLPEVGTWEKFCNYVGLSRQKVDLDLQNLSTFGEDFLLTVSSLSVGYRDLRKLRQLAHDGGFTVSSECVEIGGERIPLSADHKEDLQAAIERVLDEKAEALENAQATVKAKDRVLQSKEEVIKRQEKELSKLSREAAAHDLTPEEDAFLQRLHSLSTSFDGYLLQLRAFTEVPEIPGIRAASTLLAFLNKARMELNAYYATAYDNHAAFDMAPEEEWEPGKGSAIPFPGEG